MIDAEHTWYQPALDAFTLMLSEEFNKPPAPGSDWKGPLILSVDHYRNVRWHIFDADDPAVPTNPTLLVSHSTCSLRSSMPRKRAMSWVSSSSAVPTLCKSDNGGKTKVDREPTPSGQSAFPFLFPSQHLLLSPKPRDADQPAASLLPIWHTTIRSTQSSRPSRISSTRPNRTKPYLSYLAPTMPSRAISSLAIWSSTASPPPRLRDLMGPSRSFCD